MEKSERGELVILSGPSGCGKTTIADCLTKERSFCRSISATTRPPRRGEQDGIDYFFISEYEFCQKIEKGEFIEHATYHSFRYGTPAEPLYDTVAGGANVLLVIEVQGALQIMKKLPGCLSIFILPPDIDVLQERLAKRGLNSREDIKQRLEIALNEMSQKRYYTCSVINDDLDTTVSSIKNIIKRHKTCQTTCQKT